MDRIDYANALEDVHRSRALAARHFAPAGPPIIGTCHHCETKLPRPRRWCDAACRDEWQREVKRVPS